MERSRGDIRQWSWVWEQEIERVQFVSSATMEDNYARKAEEIGPEFQVVFHGTEERSNVASKVWAYLKEKKLQDPKNKMFFVPDALMRPIFGSQRQKCFGLAKQIKFHLPAPAAANSK